MGTADQDDIGETPDPTKAAPDTSGGVSDGGGDSDPDAATGDEQAEENRDRESPA